MTMQGSKKLPVVKLVDSLEASWDYVANEGTTFTLQTNYKAPRCRCVCSAAAVAVAVATAVTGAVAVLLRVASYHAAWSAGCCWRFVSQLAMGWCRLVVLFGAWQSSGCPGSQGGAGAGMQSNQGPGRVVAALASGREWC